MEGWTAGLGTNALEHGSIQVKAERSEKCLHVCVFDDGSALAQRQQADPWATSSAV